MGRSTRSGSQGPASSLPLYLSISAIRKWACDPHGCDRVRHGQNAAWRDAPGAACDGWSSSSPSLIPARSLRNIWPSSSTEPEMTAGGQTIINYACGEEHRRYAASEGRVHVKLKCGASSGPDRRCGVGAHGTACHIYVLRIGGACSMYRRICRSLHVDNAAESTK